MISSDKLKEFLKKARFFLIKLGRAILSYAKEAKLELIILAAVLAFDLISKALVAGLMQRGQTINIIPSFLNFHYTINPFASFGSFFGLEKVLAADTIRVILLFITFFSLIALSIFMYKFKDQHIISKIAFALIIAGALGNFVDRLFLRGVRDFIEIVFFGLDIPFLGGETFAIFNIADMSLIIGLILLSVFIIFMYREPKTELVGPIYQPNYKKDAKNDIIDTDSDVGGDI